MNIGSKNKPRMAETVSPANQPIPGSTRAAAKGTSSRRPSCRAEAYRQVGGHGRFADAAFAGSHGDDAVNSGQRLRRGRWTGLLVTSRDAAIRAVGGC